MGVFLLFAMISGGLVLQGQTVDADLRATVARQQREIDELKASMKEQRLLIDRLMGVSTIPVPVQSAVAPPPPVPAPAATTSPFLIRAGRFEITPSGLFDFGAVFRSTNVGSGLGTNFGSIPFSNTPAGQLSEVRLSAQNTRLGLRVGTTVGKTAFTGILEADFLGNFPANGYVANNAAGPRIRLAYMELRRGKWEFLAGQAYSFLTPNRIGVSSSPRDVFLTQAVDPNFHVGLNWTRAPQLRVVYHPNKQWSLGLALENPEQFIGSGVTIPVALSSAYAAQTDNGTITSAPNLHPDILPKAAWDGVLGKRTLHLEAVGLVRTFKSYNLATGNTFTANGWGGSLNGMLSLTPRLRLTANAFWSDGGGRYTFGLGPDLIVRADGSLSPVKAGSTLGGFEYQATPKTQIYSYYGGVYFGRNTALDPQGRLSGFGQSGGPSSANRDIQQASFGFVRAIWRDAQHGAFLMNWQYSWLTRSPWYAVPGQPANASTNIVYLNLRYVTP